MFKFLRKHPPKDSEERSQLKKELFGYRRCLDHGFPSKPSCMAYDPKLKLLAIGTKTGRIKIVGAPGVEWSVELRPDVSVNQLFFLPEQGRLLSLCSDNTVYLWEINHTGGKSLLEQKKEYTFSVDESRMKGISVCCLTNNCEQLLIGTEIGNIYILDLNTFKLLDQIIYQDVVMQNVPDDFKVNPGAIEALAVHPTEKEKFLIGYNRGLIVLWDNEASNADQTYNSTQQLESLSWHRNGKEFMSAHNDGSYIVWSTSDSTTPKESAITPYGPFPCKAISKIDWKTAKLDPFIIFAGGMPRASYGDRHTVSVMQGSNNIHTVLDFTSKVVDFITISKADESEDSMETDEPHTLVVLAEEELVLIDLETQGWPTFSLPYLNSLHCSPITCSQHVSNIPDNLWQKIIDAGQAQSKNVSSREWPLNGGNIVGAESLTKDILLTGHEDGTVRFWDASSTSMSLLYKLSTASLFNVDIHGEHNCGEVEEEWPPFRKVGSYDPFSDDPRLGIQKIALCPLSETLVVAGTAGQVVVLRAEREERELEVSSTTVNVVSDHDGFVWKGHEALGKKEGEVTFPTGFQPVAVMQISPPAACTALAFHSEWQLVAAGTAHGFGLFDYAQKKEVTSRCTLNPEDLTGTSDTPISRRKSFKKSLRESFRRLRRRRSERRKAAEEKAKEEKKESEEKTEGIEVKSSPTKTPPASPESRPVERQVEARNPEDSIGSMVRCLYFASTYISDVSNTTSSLWVGTNGGHVYIYTITVPQEKRSESEVSATIAKEIKLRHKAPVMSIAVVDGRTRVLPDPLEVQHARAKEPQGSNHSVVICSEEQLKIFTLPHLKAKWKYKITALNGSRIRKVAFVNFRSRSDENYSEYDIACLNNQGELSVYSVSTLRQQLEASCLRREDINGISSFTFTKNGQGFYLQSASEYARVTLSARYITEPTCSLELKEGMRIPAPEPEVPAQEAAQTEDTAEEEAVPYGSGDIAEGLNDSALNDSQANTTMEGEITQDSVQIMQVTEEISSSNETTRTTTVQETRTIISGDGTENSTITSTVTESSQLVTSSGDAPATGNIEESKTPPPVTQVIEKTEEELTKLKISNEDEAMNKRPALDTTAEIQGTVTAS